MRYLLALEHAREHLALLNADGSHQHGLPLGVGLADLIHDRVEFFTPRFVDEIVQVFPDARTVRGRDCHVQLVNVVEFVRLGFGGAGHPG